MFSDRCCGEYFSAPCTNLFVEYVDIMQMTMCYTGLPEWISDKIIRLEDMIRKFKRRETDLFGNYHSSFRTEKFHSLDYICEDIGRKGGIVYGDAGLYEYSRTLVKRAYRSGSERRHNAMDETILSFLKEMNNSALQKLFNAESGKVRNQRLENVQNPNLAQNEARRTDCAVLVKKSTPFLL